MKRVSLFIFFLCHFFCSFGQLLYPIVGNYKKKSAQSMAIWAESAYLFNNGGLCRVYDLINSEVKSEFVLSSASDNNHVNAACFGVEIPDHGTLPYLYITECNYPYRCFVEKISGEKAFLVQTINASLQNKPLQAGVWTIDCDNKVLYCLTRSTLPLLTKGYSINTVSGFRLPKIEEGKEILLTEKDLVCQFDVLYPNINQDAIVKKGKMYVATGYEQSLSNKPEGERAIQIIDLKKKRLHKTIHLTYLTTNEPEGIDFYNGNLLLFCGQEGGIYKIHK